MKDITSLAPPFVLSREQISQLFGLLAEEALMIGPVSQRGAVALAPVVRASDLVDCIGSAATPIKRFFHPPMQRVFMARRENGRFALEDAGEPGKQAIFGVRPCDLHALTYLDRALIHDFRDPLYEEARRNTFIVAANCTEVAENCHCVSYGTGPEAKEGFDIALTNLGDGYLLEVGSRAGLDVAERMALHAAAEEDLETKRQRLAAAAEQMRPSFDAAGVAELLSVNYRHLAWREEAAKCLGCGNCAMVCPTCYCYNVIDKIAIPPDRVERMRFWDVCLLQEFSEVHGANFRLEREARYQQFVCHKLVYSLDQYAMFGCVGCGRCMTWCPADIDYRETVSRIREGQ